MQRLIPIAEPKFTKNAVDVPRLNVPPASRGNRTRARFPSRSGGNLRLKGVGFLRAYLLAALPSSAFCRHASETLALPVRAALGTRASRPQSRPREKKTYPFKGTYGGGYLWTMG